MANKNYSRPPENVPLDPTDQALLAGVLDFWLDRNDPLPFAHPHPLSDEIERLRELFRDRARKRLRGAWKPFKKDVS